MTGGERGSRSDRRQEPPARPRHPGTVLARHAVDRCYTLILADERLRPYFVGVNLHRLKRHVAALLAGTLHGPAPQRVEELVAAHRGLGLSDEDSALIGRYLVAGLQRYRTSAELLWRLGAVVLAARGPLLGAPRRVPRSA